VCGAEIEGSVVKPDEEFVLKSVASFYGGEWSPGEDPPDAYLMVIGRKIAVEVSILTQVITDDRGTRPRLSDDMPAIRLANELDLELRRLMPAGKLVTLVLSTPIIEHRKTKAALATVIRSLLNAGVAKRNVTIRGNQVEISVNDWDALEGKKIVAAVKPRSSSPDILKNATNILEDRIRIKAQKCAALKLPEPIWLALLNDYFLAEPETYVHALKSIAVAHPFEKVLLVSGGGAVAVLVDTMG
jgi:hypothetical protein